LSSVVVVIEVVVDVLVVVVVARNAQSQLEVHTSPGGQNAPAGELKSQSSPRSSKPLPQVAGCAEVDSADTTANVAAIASPASRVKTSLMDWSTRSSRRGRPSRLSSFIVSPS
jgi:hypothetical protein